jgi:hypothetical protein
MKMLKKALIERKKEVLGSLVMIAVIVIPFVTFASNRNDIYVNVNASGTENGSTSHPYKTISRALDNANEKTNVHIAKGTYKENIEIPAGVRIFGESRDGVVIDPKDDDKSVVTMRNASQINKVTIKGGENGIKIREGAKASIVKCVVKDNDKDGIRIEEAKVLDTRKVSITDSIIKNNGRTGIYAQTRRIVIMNNEITNNGTNGIDLAPGTSAWVEDNEIKDNDESGMKLILDRSNVWTKDNEMRGNDNQGIEIESRGNSGRVDINDSNISSNSNYGIAKIQTRAGSVSIWNGLTIQNNNKYYQNNNGNISSVIRAF